VDFLSASTVRTREAILRELFATASGANFTVCRMPVAPTILAGLYSYDEVPGELPRSISAFPGTSRRSCPSLGRAAVSADLKLWPSLGVLPTWMKYNKHYAAKPSEADMPPNGLDPTRWPKRAPTQFIQRNRYLSAYAPTLALHQDYAKQGIRIGVVIPERNFNSTQLSELLLDRPGAGPIHRFPRARDEKLNVDVFFGTMERPNETLLELSLRDPEGRQIRQARGISVGR